MAPLSDSSIEGVGFATSGSEETGMVVQLKELALNEVT